MTVQRVSDLRARMRSLGELREVVGAMRSLAAVRIQQAQETLEAIREYASVVERALCDSAPYPPPGSDATVVEQPPPMTGVVAFGSEHGFVGAYNDRVLDRALGQVDGPRDSIFVVGARAALLAKELEHPIAWTCPMASHVGGVDDVALRTAAEIANGVAEGLTRVVLVYTRSARGEASQVVAETLLPFDVRPYASTRGRRPPPLSNLRPRALFDRLVEELTFAQLARAATESFASENAARLAAMDSAHENIDNKLVDLVRLEREGRQEEITTELLDIVTGAEVVGRPGALG